MLDNEIIEDFVLQLQESSKSLLELLHFLKNETNRSEYFVRCGEIADRLFGAISMIGIEEITHYFRTMKQVFYKCSCSNSEVAQEKVIELITNMAQILDYIAPNISNGVELKKIYFKMGLCTKKGEKLLLSYFFSIKQDSAAFSRDDTGILVYDKSCRLEMILKESKQVLHPPLKLYNALQGFKKELQMPSFKVEGVVVDTDCSANIWMELLRMCIFSLPGVPVMMMAKDPKTLDAYDKASLGIRVIVPSSISPEKIIERFKELDRADSRSSVTLPLVANVEEGTIEDFIAISRSAFSLCHHSEFDLFIRVGSSKFIKILEHGNDLEQEQLDRQQDCFYIAKKQFESYLAAFNRSICQIISDPSLDLSVKKINFDEFCIDVLKDLSSLGACEEKLVYAREILNHSTPLLSQLITKTPKLQELVLDLSSFEHSVAVSLIVGLFLKEIEANKNIYDEIFMAALVHDIGLLSSSDNTKSEDLSKMDDGDKAVFYAHTLESAKIASSMGLKPVLCEAILHHHQRIDGSGFPPSEKGCALTVNRIGELIGLAEELLLLIHNAEDDGPLPTEILRLNLTGRYSKTIKNAFDLVFPPN